ncbi:hypothetical protein TNCV_4405471 [Trichonephila clavipes]|uniref:Uncharacterized protein n=1 Tax=Trichonephila clavipes TaxID=2585209 RepID=A0A8X6S518_TRICX|nr:hypothetical protein TNCV_4405471 [Trichonephila clavipes]
MIEVAEAAVPQGPRDRNGDDFLKTERWSLRSNGLHGTRTIHQRNAVLDESRSFFRVHTGYFSNIPKCIKAEFIASWACSQSSVVSSSKR